VLVSRSKHAESSFLELYQQLYEAPDPVGVLHGALGAESQLAQLVAQNAKLHRELQEFQTESQGIKNQELTIRKLEERCKALEAELSAKVHSFTCVASKDKGFGRYDIAICTGFYIVWAGAGRLLSWNTEQLKCSEDS
jgi:hypothetical protein